MWLVVVASTVQQWGRTLPPLAQIALQGLFPLALRRRARVVLMANSAPPAATSASMRVLRLHFPLMDKPALGAKVENMSIRNSRSAFLVHRAHINLKAIKIVASNALTARLDSPSAPRVWRKQRASLASVRLVPRAIQPTMKSVFRAWPERTPRFLALNNVQNVRRGT